MSAHARSRIRFTPVQLKARHDGWSPARQRRFIDTLAATQSVAAACRAVGMTRASAYKLREKDCRGQSEHATRDREGPDNGFAEAWESALRFDPSPPSRRSPRAALLLRRIAARPKVDEAREAHEAPVSPPPAASRSSTLATLLEALRAQDLQPPFDGA